MSTHSLADRICVIAILLSLAVTVLFMNGERLGIAAVVDEDAEGGATSVWFTANDLKADWDTSEATRITLSGDSASIAGNGAYWLDGDVVLAQSGQYVISGELTDGSIIVDAEAYSKVWILLDGVSVTCSDDACLRISQADKVFVTLAEGTENSLNGAASYSEEALAGGTDAVIFSHDDLTINGSGSLNVTASCLNGITSRDDLVITGGTISVTAPAHGIKVNDHFRLTSAMLAVTAGEDGIHSDLDWLMESGSITVSARDDGIHADSLVQILGGSLTITGCYEGIEAVIIEQYGGEVTIDAQDDGLNANGYTGYDFAGGMMAVQNTADAEEQTLVTAEETYVLIAGGSLTITNTGGMDADGIDSNGNILITGGTVRISMENNNGNSALDCGTEAGGQALISGGTVIACCNYAMAESFDSASEQYSLLYTISEGVSAGTSVSLLRQDGSVLISEEIPCGFSSVILSCPDMTSGESYRLVIGSTEEEITLTEASSSFGDASGWMLTGFMNQGGPQPMQTGTEGMAPPDLTGQAMTGTLSDLPAGAAGGTPPSFSAGDIDGTPPAPPEGAAGGTPPSFPAGDMDGTPPELPKGAADGTPPAFPAGDMNGTPPGFSAADTGSGITQAPASPTDLAAPGSGEPGFPGMPGQAEDSAASAQEAGQTSDWPPVCASALVLAAGLVFALGYRKSQHIDTLPAQRGRKAP